MRIVGIVICVLAVLVGIGSNLTAMIDLPSLIIVLGGALGLAIRHAVTQVSSCGSAAASITRPNSRSIT